jgi:hypothetical protein
LSHRIYHGAVVGCIDGAWAGITHSVTSRLAGGPLIDPYNRPGATLRHKHGCRFTEEVIDDLVKITIANHGAMNLFLAHHQNCLAYGGSKAFASPQSERAAHIADLRSAEQLFKELVLARTKQLLEMSELSQKERTHLEAALNGAFRVTKLFIPEANRGEVLSIKNLADCQALIVD